MWWREDVPGPWLPLTAHTGPWLGRCASLKLMGSSRRHRAQGNGLERRVTTCGWEQYKSFQVQHLPGLNVTMLSFMFLWNVYLKAFGETTVTYSPNVVFCPFKTALYSEKPRAWLSTGVRQHGVVVSNSLPLNLTHLKARATWTWQWQLGRA